MLPMKSSLSPSDGSGLVRSQTKQRYGTIPDPFLLLLLLPVSSPSTLFSIASRSSASSSPPLFLLLPFIDALSSEATSCPAILLPDGTRDFLAASSLADFLLASSSFSSSSLGLSSN